MRELKSAFTIIWMSVAILLVGVTLGCSNHTESRPETESTPATNDKGFATALTTPTIDAASVLPLTTTLPMVVSGQRTDVITYTVLVEENLFSIADKFNLHPEVILWANEETLTANPHKIQSGVVLTIPPIDGILYRWHLGDDLAKVADRFGAKPEDILNWPGNHLNPQNLHIPPGALLIIPGGHPPITSTNGITIHTP